MHNIIQRRNSIPRCNGKEHRWQESVGRRSWDLFWGQREKACTSTSSVLILCSSESSQEGGFLATEEAFIRALRCAGPSSLSLMGKTQSLEDEDRRLTWHSFYSTILCISFRSQMFWIYFSSATAHVIYLFRSRTPQIGLQHEGRGREASRRHQVLSRTKCLLSLMVLKRG